VSAHVTEDLRQAIMPQIDMQIQSHIDENDRARKYDEKMASLEKSVNAVKQ
jgi:hypothetical protein